MEQIQEKLRYKRTLVPETVIILAGEYLSTILDCGGMQPRALLIPAAWEQTNIFFNVGIFPDGEMYQVSMVATQTGSNDRVRYNAYPMAFLPIIFPDSDCFLYFQIESSTRPQEDQKIIVLLQPLYQGIHG